MIGKVLLTTVRKELTGVQGIKTSVLEACCWDISVLGILREHLKS